MFHFSPQMDPLVNPPIDSLPFGTDAWAVHHAKASVTPLRTCFAEAAIDSHWEFYEDTGNKNVANGYVGSEKVERFELLIGRPWKL
jgi:hypothetical protein